MMLAPHLRTCVLACMLQVVFSALVLQRQPILEPVGKTTSLMKNLPISQDIKSQNTNVPKSDLTDVSRQLQGSGGKNGLTSINSKAFNLGNGRNLAFAPRYVNGYGTQNARGYGQQYGARPVQQNVAANRGRQQNIPQNRVAYGKNAIGAARLQGQPLVKGGGLSKLQNRAQNPKQVSMNLGSQIYRPLNQMARTPLINGQQIYNSQRVGNVNTYVPIGQVNTMGQSLGNSQIRYGQPNFARPGYPQNAPIYNQNVPITNTAMYQRPIYTNYILPPLVRIPTSGMPVTTTTKPATAITTTVGSISMTTLNTNITPLDSISLPQFLDTDFLGCTPDELAQLASVGFSPSVGSGSTVGGLTGGLTDAGGLTGLTGALNGGEITGTLTGGIDGSLTGTGSVTGITSPTGCVPTSVDLTGAATAVSGALGGVDLTGAANTLSNMLGDGCTGSTLDLQALSGAVSGLSGSLDSGTSLSGAASALGSALSGLSLTSVTGSTSSPTLTGLLSGLAVAPTSLTGTVVASEPLSGLLSGIGGATTGGIATGSSSELTGLLSGGLSGIGGALTGVTGSVSLPESSSLLGSGLTGTCSALALLNLGRR